MQSDKIEVALFPIPEVVAFPGTVVPLHVFEPRYRQLVHDCVEQNRPIGVSHVAKVIHEPKRSQTVEEALSSNQATYKPRKVFSAGHCEVLETLDDGRIIVQITMDQRVALIDEVQSLPYRIVSCEVVEDEDDPDAAEDNTALQVTINDRLIEIVGEQSPDLVRALQAGEWVDLEASEYSFKIFQFLKLDAEVMQMILEARSTNERLGMIWEVLRRA